MVVDGLNDVVETSRADRARRRELWLRRALTAVGVLIFLIVASMIGAAFLPRWWAHRIGDQVRESIWLGVSLGLLYGFLFTLAAVAALRFAFSKRRPIKVWLIWIGVALLLALPNLLTLGIAAGTGHGAHAGQRTLDVQAPGYRGAALAGAISAVIVLGLWEWLRLSRHHSKRRIEALRAKLRNREPGPPAGG